MSFYGIIPETVYTMTSVTTKPTRKFESEKTLFAYHKIKKEAFIGYALTKIEDEQIYIATAEKALADYCYYIYLHKKKWNDRIYLENINFKKLKAYLLCFQKPNLIINTKKYITNL